MQSASSSPIFPERSRIAGAVASSCFYLKYFYLVNCESVREGYFPGGGMIIEQWGKNKK